MTEISITFFATYLVVAAAMILHPWFSRKNVPFGVVFGSSDVWGCKEAVAVRKRYLAEVITIALVVGISSVIFNALAFFSIASLSLCSTLLLILLSVFPFVHANKSMKKFKAGLKYSNEDLLGSKISIEIGEEQKAVISAFWTLLLFIPIIPTVILALRGYNSMPSSLATHYTFTAADAWSPKSWSVVLLPVIMQIALGGLFLILCLLVRHAPASVRGNPNAAPGYKKFRKYMVVLLLILGIAMQFTFMIMEISYLKPISAILIIMPSILSLPVVVVMFYIYFKFVRVKKPSGAVLDDDSKWILGMFYFNPQDPALFVEKRTGIGFTMNNARPLAWVIILGLILIIVAIPIIVH